MKTRHRFAAVAGAVAALCVAGGTVAAQSNDWEPGPASWTGDLTPVAAADWSYDRAEHLLGRAGFSGTPEDVRRLADMTPEEAVSALVDYDEIPNDHLEPFEHSGFWDETLMHFPPSRPAATDRAMALGASMGIRVKPEFVNRHMQPVSDRFFYWLRATALETRRVGYWWAERMLDTNRPLQEKMALFWHHVFATGDSKVENSYQMLAQVQIFRDHGMGNYRDLLVRLAHDPAMLYWLDQNENHKRSPNENWGRELLELFSMGTSNYTEKDVFECSRAFTGWTMGAKIHHLLWGPHLWPFEFHAEDHDTGSKSFLGHEGKFNGEDVIDIIVRQPACHRFIMRHLYNFFVADEPQVPAWPIEPPGNPEAIREMCRVFVESGYEMKPVLRYMFNSDFFKNARYQKVRNPAEVVAGTLRLTGDLNTPDPRWGDMGNQTGYMGQALLDPPSVEGWHTGREWINSGALINRVNFMADQMRNIDNPGVSDIVERVAASNGRDMTPEHLVDECLEILGPLEVKEKTREELVEQAGAAGPIDMTTDTGYEEFKGRVGEVMALIAGTREYQFG